MKYLKHSILFLFLVTAINGKAQEQKKSKAGGPPETKDLIGYWKMVPIPNADKVNKVNPWPQPYQWVAFLENGKVYSMMTDTDYDYTPEMLKQIFDVLPAAKTPNYVHNGQFLTIDSKEIKDYQELWGVNLFAMDVKSFIKAGDLMMTLDDGSGNVIYYRLLRKIK